MNTRNSTIRAALLSIATACLVWSMCEDGAKARQSLSKQEKRGKQIYTKGEAEGGEIIAVLGRGDLELPGSSFTCSNCHGLRGEGLSEGGLQPSPLTWDVLTNPRKSPLTGRVRPAYDDVTLERSIIAGIEPGGGPLHPGMPRYKMATDQVADLIAYLKKIGEDIDADPGLTDEAIRIGAALPMSGNLAGLGEDVKSALAACFADVNSQGGVYGRKFELVVEDSRSEPGGTEAASRRLIDRQGVFALVASFEPADSVAANDLIGKSEVPLIGPVTLSPVLSSVPNRFVFYLLPSFKDQARSLVDYLGLKPRKTGAKAAIIFADRSFDRDAAEGVKTQAGRYLMSVVSETRYPVGQFQAEATARAISRQKPDHIFFFGNSDDIVAFAREIDRLNVEASLLSSAIMIGRGAFSLPERVAARTFLSYPASLPDSDDFTEFVKVMQKSGVPIRSAAFQAVAFAAAKTVVEAAKMAGRRLNRAELVNSMEQLRHFKTGVIAPLSFGPNRRVGSTGSYVVGIDLANRNYTTLSERIAPKE